MSKIQRTKIKLLNQILRAIKNKCQKDCCANDRKSWKDCTLTDCPLYPYRLGNTRNLNKTTQEN